MPSDEEMQYNNLCGDEEESEDEDADEIDEDDEEDLDSPSTSSEAIIASQTPISIPTTIIATAAPNTHTLPPQQPTEVKKPSPFDDSRKLFQRLWTDEDEIGLLQGFLDYRIEKGGSNHASYHIDNAMFYDQIKNQLQLDFNKNQLVEKLRRLKKKYRNAVNRITSGKEFTFKTPHDQTTFEISHKIWGGTASSIGGEETKIELDCEQKLLNSETKHEYNDGSSVNNAEKKAAELRKRSRQVVEEDNVPNLLKKQENSSTTPSVIEDTIRSCLSPLVKELLHCATNGHCSLGGIGGVALDPFHLKFGGNSSMSGEVMDEKWRKQQILELEVYSKRMELVQDQIKLALEELKSPGS